jgi:hypothetical protein
MIKKKEKNPTTIQTRTTPALKTAPFGDVDSFAKIKRRIDPMKVRDRITSALFVVPNTRAMIAPQEAMPARPNAYFTAGTFALAALAN